MKYKKITDNIADIKMWKSGTHRAPNKPLLLLHAIARCSRGESSEQPYNEISPKLKDLLHEFGHPRSQQHPEYPFWRLQRDGVWVVRDSDDLTFTASGDPHVKVLRKINPLGGLTTEFEKALQDDPHFLAQTTANLLNMNFPKSIHEDILAAVGMQLVVFTSNRRVKRDPAFRVKILRAYERRCAVCGFDLRLGTMDVALEAAHIMWHQAGGPDIEPNGLALCSLHHKLLDRGAFTVSNDRKVLVSQEISGSQGMEEHLLRFHAKPIRNPQSEEFLPSLEFLSWHRNEVFRGPGRS